MAIGWFVNLTEAESYFSDERLETSAWDGLSVTSSKDEKTVVLNMAYNRLYYCGLFELPTFTEASDAQLIILKKAQAEIAYYMAIHLADEDRRTGLQAQGIIRAGIVKEDYQSSGFVQLPIPPIVYGLLAEFIIDADAKAIYVSAVDRDEDEEDMEL